VKTLDRYVLLSFVKNYIISLAVLLGVYIVLDMVVNFNELANIQGQNATGNVDSFFAVVTGIGSYYFYQSFLIFARLSGIIPVTAAAFTLLRMSRFNELSAMLAAGIPLLRVAAPIVFACLGANVLLLADQEIVIPHMIPELTKRHDEVNQAVDRTFRIDAMQDEGNSLVNAAKYTPPDGATPAEMYELSVIERDSRNRATAMITAVRATYDPAKHGWDLDKGHRLSGLGPGQKISAERAIRFWQTSVTPEEVTLYRSNSYVELLSTERINRLLERPRSYGVNNLLTVKHQRVTQWLMNLVLVLLAIPCVLTREPGQLKANMIKLLITIGLAMSAVFLARQISIKPPSSAWITRWPIIFAWLPVFMFAPVAIYMLDQLHVKRS
jgi:lipopolysaccharide export LptBFGC system permease protein LptF